jgi:hypothetical protein
LAIAKLLAGQNLLMTEMQAMEMPQQLAEVEGEFAEVGLLKRAAGKKASQAAAVEMLSAKMPASLARKEEKVVQPKAS